MEINVNSEIEIRISFSERDLQTIRAGRADVPNFWTGHTTPPALGDVLRFGSWQAAIAGRAWEHDGHRAVLRLYMTDLAPRTDTTLH